MNKSDEEEVVVPGTKVRISPRISRNTYALAKAMYPLMGVTLEERIEYLLVRDLTKEMKKTWFKNLWKEDGFGPKDEEGEA
ncbi:hypothetical protein [Ralstonia solanacearum]|uniref:hypothetical protein n=1 Tax=Ralstonia solanacearum TaxID=305 RepID=UPI00202A9246|nr:hypothetical protein [Ralstonia solanacearum]MCL9844628.1 hypothetical protein [Ralstonia solanacearum]MDC6253153.1 hypothetical protein [Ralstonia solanacearum]MDC6257735.1 hypothetical protein [Ralstonia solanacearum]MDC6301609.1 hypothetical protein [Ralstonia solanacearum]